MRKLLALLVASVSLLQAQAWEPVLTFWFEELQPSQWWTSDPALDTEIEQRFGRLMVAAQEGKLNSWNATARGQLAKILLLDQFSRNVYRGTPHAFANDARARAIAGDMVIRGTDQKLQPHERMFVYLPFEHAESMEFQDQAVELFTRLAQQNPHFQLPLDFAIRHRDVIEQFGRFPHRNAILGRQSTPAEEEYLAQPGAGF